MIRRILLPLVLLVLQCLVPAGAAVGCTVVDLMPAFWQALAGNNPAAQMRTTVIDYAAPLCGPSRCLLMTGRYAFRTGGITNGSWRKDGPGALSKDEWSVAKVLKQAGYATGEAGKWRQVGETPHDWGFDEYITDPTASGWYWKNSYEKNGQQIRTDKEVYNPDIIQAFSIDFITPVAIPSIRLSITLPTKPSVTITSTTPPKTSRPSTLPTKLIRLSAFSIARAWSRFSPCSAHR